MLNDDDLEQVWTSLHIGNEKILCGCIYRPGTIDYESNLKIINSIKRSYNLLIKSNYSGLLICGDFNYFSIKWNKENIGELINNSDISAKEFLKCLNDCFITQNVIKPTFQINEFKSTNVLDLILTESNKRIVDLNHFDNLGALSHGHQILKFLYCFRNNLKKTETVKKI